jgi:hypothetical protein
MSEKTNHKGWVSVLVAAAFVVLGITGLLMLLHIRIPLDLKIVHIVMGVVFVAAGIIHLVLNWKTFAAHFGNRSAVIAGAVAIVITAALLIAGGIVGPEQHRYGPGQEEIGNSPGGPGGPGAPGGNGPAPFDNGQQGNGPGPSGNNGEVNEE